MCLALPRGWLPLETSSPRAPWTLCLKPSTSSLAPRTVVYAIPFAQTQRFTKPSQSKKETSTIKVEGFKLIGKSYYKLKMILTNTKNPSRQASFFEFGTSSLAPEALPFKSPPSQLLSLEPLPSIIYLLRQNVSQAQILFDWIPSIGRGQFTSFVAVQSSVKWTYICPLSNTKWA